MTKINSLYSLIKEQTKVKGRSLKVVCDWDEVIQPLNPGIWWKLAKEKGWEVVGYEKTFPSFQEFFEHYWKNGRVEFEGSCPWTKYTTIKEVEEIRKKNDKELMKQQVWDPLFAIMNGSQYYEAVDFLSPAKDLQKALNDDLISELDFVSTTAGADGRKRKQTKKYFPGCQIHLNNSRHFSRTGEYRWQWIKNNHPDFDIFIDDSPSIIEETKEQFGSEKIYVMIDYPIVEIIEGVYRVPSTPLVKHSKMAELAESYQKNKTKYNNAAERERENLLNGGKRSDWFCFRNFVHLTINISN